MNLLQYKNLCNMCDDILYRNPQNIALHAIPWLHVLRYHPSFIQSYESSSSFSFPSSSIKFLKYIASCTRNLFLSLIRQFFVRPKQVLFFEPRQVIFISHLFSRNSFSQDLDFYYGEIPSQLSSKGKKLLTLYINQSTAFSYLDKDLHLGPGDSSSIIPDILRFEDELYLITISLRSIYKFLCNNFRSIVLNHNPIYLNALIDLFSPATLSNIRIGYYISRFIDKNLPCLLVTTYEGHAYERLAYYFAHKCNAKCAGYQHAAIFAHQHAIFRPLNGPYNPDFVLTSGTHSQKKFSQIPQPFSSKIIQIGSHRYQNDSIISSSPHCSQEHCRYTCLVLPESFSNETLYLFRFALEAATLNSRIKFILRPHPNFNFADVIIHEHSFRSPPKNIMISNSSLSEDIANSNFALYRGSTAVIQATQMGLTPIYLNDSTEMLIDPLHEIHNCLPTVSTPQQICSLITSMTRGEQIQVRSLVKTYNKSIYTTSDINNFLSIFS